MSVGRSIGRTVGTTIGSPLRGDALPWEMHPGASLGPPALVSISPSLGDTFGGATITLTGRWLRDVTGVTFGGTAGTSVTENSDGTVIVTAPAKAAGSYDIVVTTSRGSSTLASGYEAWSPLTDYAAARVCQSDQGTHEVAARTRRHVTRKIADPGGTGGSAFTISRDGVAVLPIAYGGASSGYRLIMFGGWHTAAFESGTVDTTNEVLYSDDLGVTWTQLLAHDANPPTTGATARWRRRHSHAHCLHTASNGVTYIYLFGGDQFDGTAFPSGYPEDLWRSADGYTWERVLASVTNANHRMAAMMWSQGGNLYIAGGQSDINDTSTARNDVLKSTDDGATWSSLGNASWTARGWIQGPIPVVSGKAYICGGACYHTVVGSRLFRKDVWEYDGTSWTQKTADYGGTSVIYHNTPTFDSRLFITRGNDNTGVNTNETWWSADSGATWTQETNIKVDTNHAAACPVVNGRPYYIGGTTNATDAANFRIWTMDSGDGAAMDTITDQGSGALVPTQATAAKRPILVQSILNGQPGIVFDGTNDALQLGTKDNSSANGWLFAVVVRSWKNAARDNNINPAQVALGTIATTEFNEGPGFSGTASSYNENATAAPNGNLDTGSGYVDDKLRLFIVTHKSDGTVKQYEGSTLLATSSKSYSATHTGWDALGAGYSADGVTGQNFLDGVIAASVVIKTDPAGIAASFYTKLAKWAMKWGSVST